MGLHRVGHDCSDLACMHVLEKEMAAHSSVLAWRLPGTGEPGGLPSMGSHRVGDDWRDLAATAAWIKGSPYLFLLRCCCFIARSCPIPCDPMDGSPPGSSGILQARVLKGLPFPSPGDLPDPGIGPSSPAWQADSLPRRHLESHPCFLSPISFIGTFSICVAPSQMTWTDTQFFLLPDARGHSK